VHGQHSGAANQELIDEPPGCLGAALAALDDDAQEGTCLSQAALGAVMPFGRPSADLATRLDRFCDQLQLPRLDWSAAGVRGDWWGVVWRGEKR